MLEDSAAGVEAAVAAGCKAIGFMGGSHLGDGWVDSFMLMNAGALTTSGCMDGAKHLIVSQTKELSWK